MLLYCKPLQRWDRKWHNFAGRGGQSQYSFNNIQYSSRCPILKTCLLYHQAEHPFGTKYKIQQGKPWSINLKDEYEFSFDFLTFVHFTSYSFVLRVFDSQSELSRFFLTFVPCLLLLLASITLSLSSLAYHHTFTFHFSWTYTGTL